MQKGYKVRSNVKRSRTKEHSINVKGSKNGNQHNTTTQQGQELKSNIAQ